MATNAFYVTTPLVCSPSAPAGFCGRCGTELPHGRRRWCSDACREDWYDNHRWTNAREEAMRRASRKCARCEKRATEVDHIQPRRGVPMHPPTCLHHQSNLRALCRECHRTRREWDA